MLAHRPLAFKTSPGVNECVLAHDLIERKGWDSPSRSQRQSLWDSARHDRGKKVVAFT